MKCNELKAHRFITTDELFTEANAGALYYEKSKADNVIAELKYSVATLETDLAMSQRWINVDDKIPTADEGYILVLRDDGVPDIGYIGAEDDVIETVRDRGEGHSVEWWMPLPSSPKEEK